MRPTLVPRHPQDPLELRPDRRCQRRAITTDILRPASAPSRLSASLRSREANPEAGLAVLTERSVEPMDGSYVMARGCSTSKRFRGANRCTRTSPHASQQSMRPSVPAGTTRLTIRVHVAHTTRQLVIEEVLTYREAAQLLKVSARTLERWTREGLVPYLRLPQRGRWSGVRFSRNQLLRWLRQRTVKER